MPDFDTRKPYEPNEPNNTGLENKHTGLENKPRLEFVVYLLVVAVPIGLLIYSSSWVGSPANLFPGHDDEGFPGSLYGIAPKYDFYTVYEPRDCPYTSSYTPCYFVTTEAVGERSLALIVEDIIRDENIEESVEESGDDLVYVYFQTPEGDPSFEAYAFKDNADAKGFFEGEKSDNMTVIDGVYLVPVE
jgi:hypothetical protein